MLALLAPAVKTEETATGDFSAKTDLNDSRSHRQARLGGRHSHGKIGFMRMDSLTLFTGKPPRPAAVICACPKVDLSGAQLLRRRVYYSTLTN